MPLFHRHHWTSISANLGRLRHPMMTDKKGSDVTLVLQRCLNCGSVQTVELTGHWPLQDLTAPAQVEEARR